MDFGLGLVLSFTDNATAGIRNAVNSLDSLTQTAERAGSSLTELASLSAFSAVATQMGSSFQNAGKGIISTFGQIINAVNTTGQTLYYAERQLDALYGGVGKGKEVIAKIQEYAETSMFDFENLIPAVTQLKSVGIEAFDAITSSTGNAQYSLLDYASALASFAPQMKNAYGTGINAAIGAMREYIAEGNALSLKRGAGLDITGILGEDKGGSIEERTRQVADLIEQLGMLGMVDAMKSSPQVMLSNMGDTLFKLKGMISESGVYQAWTDLISKMYGYVSAIPDEELQSIANTIGSALTSIMQPLNWVIDRVIDLADAIRGFVANNPSLAKAVTIGVALAGILLVVSGFALKFAGSLGYLSLMLSQFSGAFAMIGTTMKAGAVKIIGALAPITLALGAMYLVWRNDLFGIRTLVTGFVQNVVNSFKTAKTAVSGSLADMQSTLKAFDTQNSFFDGLTLAIMKVMVLFQALAEGWNDYTLSEETFKKAEELGILPLIEAIFDLKYRFGLFKDGFIAGWQEISNRVKTFIQGLSESVDGTIFEGMFDGITSFFQALASGDAQAWYDFGKSFADFTAGALALWAVLKSINTVLGAIAKVYTVFKGIGTVFKGFSKIGGAIKSAFPFITGLFKGVGEFISLVKLGLADGYGFFKSIEVALQIMGSTLGGVMSLISGIALAVTGFVKQLIDGFSWFWEIIKWVGLALATVGAVILGAPALVAGIIAGIIGLITTLIVVIKDNWQAICDFFSTIGNWIYDNVIKPVADFFVGLWNGIVTGVTTAVNGIKTFFSTIASWIYNNVIAPVVNFFTTYIYPFIEKIVEIVAKIIEIVTTLVSVGIQWLVSKFMEIVNWINTNVIQPIISFFTNLWNTIVTGITTFISTAMSIIGTIVGWIDTNIIQPISTFFTNLWNGIVTGVTSFIESVKSVFLTIVSWISNNIITPISTFFSGLWESIKTAFNTVADTITSVLKGAVNTVFNFIGGIINGVIRGINTAIGVINAIPGVSISKLTELSVPQLAKGGVVESPTTALIGEAGTEAVMPLENNTQWIGVLANMITQEMRSIRPTGSSVSNNTSNTDTTNSYLTTSNTQNQTYHGDTDNSINFSNGAIQITVQNATEEEAMKLAKMIMEYIKRQKQLDKMLNYA